MHLKCDQNGLVRGQQKSFGFLRLFLKQLVLCYGERSDVVEDALGVKTFKNDLLYVSC